MADKANTAEKASALHLEQLCNLQKKFCLAETANDRLVNAFSGVEDQLLSLIDVLVAEERKRCVNTDNLKTSMEDLTTENMNLKRKLTAAQKSVMDHEDGTQRYEAQVYDLQNRLQLLENETSAMRSQLNDALKREATAETLLKNHEAEIYDLQNSLEVEKTKTRGRAEYLKGQTDIRTELNETKKENEKLQEALKQSKNENHHALVCFLISNFKPLLMLRNDNKMLTKESYKN